MRTTARLGFAVICLLAAPVQAQTVSPDITEALTEQGYTITGTRYTWLRRIVVEATNGVYDREILISRGAGIVLQDNIQPIAPKGKTAEPPLEPPPVSGKAPPPSGAAPGPGPGPESGPGGGGDGPGGGEGGRGGG